MNWKFVVPVLLAAFLVVGILGCNRDDAKDAGDVISPAVPATNQPLTLDHLLGLDASNTAAAPGAEHDGIPYCDNFGKDWDLEYSRRRFKMVCHWRS